jgi:hypothetical protein
MIAARKHRRTARPGPAAIAIAVSCAVVPGIPSLSSFARPTAAGTLPSGGSRSLVSVSVEHLRPDPDHRWDRLLVPGALGRTASPQAHAHAKRAPRSSPSMHGRTACGVDSSLEPVMPTRRVNVESLILLPRRAPFLCLQGAGCLEVLDERRCTFAAGVLHAPRDRNARGV